MPVVILSLVSLAPSDNPNLPEVELATTDWLTERVISLPIHTELDEEQLSYITSSVLEYINQ